MILTANWDADSSNQWTIPIGGGFGKMFTVGNQAMNSKLEAYYNVERPDGAPDWVLSFTIQFLFPKENREGILGRGTARSPISNNDSLNTGITNINTVGVEE